MNKTAILAFFLLGFIHSYGQRCDSIEWSKRHDLKWKYFKGKPDKKIKATALSEPHIFFEYTTIANTAKFRFSCNFSTCHSWLKGKGTDNLLQHEQTHFDISEYYKRVLVKEIIDNKYSNKDLAVRVNEISKQILKIRKETDELYDGETNHSINEEQQKEWTKKIRKLIKKMDDYDNETYTIKLH